MSVDLFEMIKVNLHRRQNTRSRQAGVQPLVQHIKQEFAIGQTGQRIMIGCKFKFACGAFKRLFLIRDLIIAHLKGVQGCGDAQLGGHKDQNRLKHNDKDGD